MTASVLPSGENAKRRAPRPTLGDVSRRVASVSSGREGTAHKTRKTSRALGVRDRLAVGGTGQAEVAIGAHVHQLAFLSAGNRQREDAASPRFAADECDLRSVRRPGRPLLDRRVVGQPHPRRRSDPQEDKLRTRESIAGPGEITLDPVWRERRLTMAPADPVSLVTDGDTEAPTSRPARMTQTSWSPPNHQHRHRSDISCVLMRDDESSPRRTDRKSVTRS